MGEGLSRIMGDKIYRTATFPAPGFRATLYRSWERGGKVGAFIGLNPGKADGRVDDMTATKYMGFAKRWGWSAYWAFNLFEYVVTSPAVLRKRILADQPVNITPDSPLLDTLPHLNTVCLAWGNPPWGGDAGSVWHQRVDDVLAILARWQREASNVGHDTWVVCAGATKQGHPVHLSRYGYVKDPKYCSPGGFRDGHRMGCAPVVAY